jgi:hypothetical protein
MASPINTSSAIHTDSTIVTYEEVSAIFIGYWSTSHRLTSVEGVGARFEAFVALIFGPCDVAAVILACQFLVIGAFGSAV